MAAGKRISEEEDGGSGSALSSSNVRGRLEQLNLNTQPSLFEGVLKFHESLTSAMKL